MRKFLQNKEANIKEVGAVIGLFVAILIAVMVVYSIAGGMNYDTLDEQFANQIPAKDVSGTAPLGSGLYNQTPGANTSAQILTQSETFFTIAPIIGIVVVAVIILSYVTRIGG